MKKLKSLMLIILAIAILYPSLSEAVWVRQSIRKDGTIVPAHERSAPDGDRSNNLGRSSSSSNFWGSSRTRDYDGDGIYNQYDYDDDNDGVGDNFE